MHNNQPQYPHINTTDVNDSKTEDTQIQNEQPESNWPDAPTVQIPRVSSMVQDQPPEVKCIRKVSTKLMKKEDIPDIKEDKHDNCNAEYHHLITHHNTFQQSERIRQEYTDKLQDLNDNQYFQQIDQSPELTYYLPRAPYEESQVRATQTAQTTTPQRTTEELHQLFGRGRGKAKRDELHSHHLYGTQTRSLQSRIQHKMKKNKKLRQR